MPSKLRVEEAVPVKSVFLYLDNPRHEKAETETKAIERLCLKENVFQLARDISRYGLNPLERFALIPASSQSYFVAEGNRRLCAIKLLNDPDLAPVNFRKQFEKLAENWTPIRTVPGVIFGGIDDVRIWLARVHTGPQGGIGRKDWTSDQKTRFEGGNKNRWALTLLDYAEAEKIISKDDRAGKLTTVQRFVGNDVFREALGFDYNDPEEPSRTRPKAEFDVILRRFVRDLIGKVQVNSRMNRQSIMDYARPLGSLPGVTSTRIQAEPLSADSADQPRKPKQKKPNPPEKAARVVHQPDIATALRNFGNTKLISLYHSICSIELADHTPIIAVGAWSFFETLTACGGRAEKTDFCSFLSNARLETFGFKGNVTSYRSTLDRIKEYGNTTKHHEILAAFNGDQLNNDMTALKGIILKCIEIAK